MYQLELLTVYPPTNEKTTSRRVNGDQNLRSVCIVFPETGGGSGIVCRLVMTQGFSFACLSGMSACVSTVEAFEVGGEYVGLGRSINDVLVFLVSESSGCNEILLLEIYNTLSSALTTLTG